MPTLNVEKKFVLNNLVVNQLKSVINIKLPVFYTEFKGQSNSVFQCVAKTNNKVLYG